MTASTDAWNIERIFESVTLYTTESNEDTFKPDTVLDNFHHQAEISISNRALLAGLLMLWLKQCVVFTLPHEVLVADVGYPTILLVFRLVPAMAGCLQAGFEFFVEVFAM